MPGSRMTREDRRDIEDGLAGGLTYSEIAGRLSRPVSTIGREVARNGGRATYRADQAHRATEGRARRNGPTAVKAAPAGVAAYGRDPQVVHQFEERFTALMVGTGLPRMTARVLACLYATDTGSLTAAELVHRLRVSPASVSKAIGDLETQDLIKRERDARGRRDRYVIDDHVWYRAWLNSVRANLALADTVRQGSDSFGAATPAGARLQDMSQFLQHVSRVLIHAAEDWRRTSAARPRKSTR
ncbi:GbsR/MarR family transcriptional regulator [Amycolatopsis magusensis]|uniref:DNA-binding transcriptional ArsR family regulator n=1 Tax=Amycolatopsis magusensis TaxID=882444 RepID=A0ABS4PW18_9PSEU|nr:helix-turn-helix domain-containing protein [Amycolatopsis magusensis]MBP2183621.1 DNA-binding transcriptional ArsR family regulator [Amycolatopsis magusensis]MDI5976731.1 helix-turn-helix domain-containing protein [Amycolatopsis magusensis]